DHATLEIQAAESSELAGPVDENTEYYAFKMNLLRAKSTGSGSCAGCNVSVFITLSSLRLFQADSTNPLELTAPVNSTVAAWQPTFHQITIDARELSDSQFRVSGT